MKRERGLEKGVCLGLLVGAMFPELARNGCFLFLLLLDPSVGLIYWCFTLDVLRLKIDQISTVLRLVIPSTRHASMYCSDRDHLEMSEVLIWTKPT